MSDRGNDRRARLRKTFLERKELEEMPDVTVRARRAEHEIPSIAQQGLWLTSQIEGPNSAYTVAAEIHLTGELDVDALSRAVDTIVRRHGSLRTRFGERDGVPYSMEVPHTQIVLEPEDVAADERAQRYRSEVQKPFSMVGEPLFRARLFRESATRHVLTVCMHHGVSDAWSVGVFLQELAAVYGAERGHSQARLPDLTVQYADYAAWERAWLESGVLERQLAYWRNQLEGVPATVSLPTDRPRPNAPGCSGAIELIAYPKALFDRIKRLSSSNRCTSYVTLLAAFAVLLHRYSSQADLAIATAVSSRRRPELEPLIGYFVNTVAIRCRISPDTSFEALLQEVRQTVADGYANQDAPFHHVVRELQLERVSAIPPLSQVMFSFQNVAFGERRLSVDGLEIDARLPDTGGAKADLMVALREHAGELRGDIEYRTDLYDADTIRRLIEHFGRLLAAIVAAPKAPIGTYDFLTEEERHRFLTAWCGDGRFESSPSLIHELFDAHVRQHPDRIALTCGAQSLSYAELAKRSDELAGTLTAAGLGPAQRCAVYAPVSADMIAAFIAILKVGAAYVPVDPRTPQERVRYILNDAEARVVVTTTQLMTSVASADRRCVLLGEREDLRTDLTQFGDVPESAVTSESPAYVIYTSGSSGQPKGVEVPHRAVARLVGGAVYMSLGPEVVFLQHFSPSFDGSVFEISAPLLTGGRLVLWDGDPADVAGLVRCARDERATAVILVPAMLALWTEEVRRTGLRLRYLLVGGDVVPAQGVRSLYEADPDVVIINVYGPTENAVFSSIHRVPRDIAAAAPVPIGKPIRGSTAYVLDAQQRLLPLGCVGELCVGGSGLALGYVGQPEWNRARFIAHPFQEDGAKLYRTGDLVRWTNEGVLEFVGRADSQVKIRGYRIELGEIESQLQRVPGVESAVVVARDDATLGKHLVGYVVSSTPDLYLLSEPEQQAWIGRCKSTLRRVLPEYMVPDAFVLLSRMPLTRSGKPDRNALPEPARESAGRVKHRAPRTDLQRILCEVWAEVLAVPEVGLDDSFFDFGGHSLLAGQLASLIRSRLNRELPLKQLFSGPTVAAVADYLLSTEASPEEGVAAIPAVTRCARAGAAPASYAQQRMWLIHQLGRGSAQYVTSNVFEVTGRLDVEALKSALASVVERHAVLRTTFVAIDRGVRQVVQENAHLPFDYAQVPPGSDDLLGAAQTALEAERARPMDPGRDLPIRIQVIRMAENRHLLALSLHHIAADRRSGEIVMEELAAEYEAFAAGRPAVLRPIDLDYRDYAVWQRESLESPVLEEQRNYWKRQLKGAPQTHSLPLRAPRPAVQDFRGRRVFEQIQGEDLKALRKLCVRQNVTLYMLIECAFALLLHRYSNANDIVIGTPSLGRSQRGLERIVGLFLNTLVLRTKIDPSATFAQLLQQSREMILDAYSREHVPFDKVVEDVQAVRSPSFNPVFQVMFGFVTGANPTLTLHGLDVKPVRQEAQRSIFELILTAVDYGDRLSFRWGYQTSVFDTAMVTAMATNLKRLLRYLVDACDVPIRELNWATQDERRRAQLQLASLQPAREGPRIHHRVEEIARRYPEREALVRGADRVSYAELNRRANRVARYLIQSGVGGQTPVALQIDDPVLFVTTALGVMKAGGVYVPLNSAYPESVRRHIVADARINLMLVEGPDLQARIDEQSDEDPGIERPTAEATAFLVYRATPAQGIASLRITSRMATGITEWLGSLGAPGAPPVVLDARPVTLEAPLSENILVLAAGGTVVIPPSDVLNDAGRLAELIVAHRVTVLAAPVWTLESLASLWRRRGSAPPAIITRDSLESEETIQDLIATVNGCEVYAVRAWLGSSFPYAARRCRTDGPAASIGTALPGNALLLLDRDGAALPDGMPGQLCVGGIGHRASPTGLFVMPSPDGTFEYLGSVNGAIKTKQGVIDTNLWQATLSDSGAIRSAFIDCDMTTGAPERATVFISSRSREQLQASMLTRLQETCEKAAHIDVAIRVTEEWPLSPEGTVDVAALRSAASDSASDDTEVEPRTDTERWLAALWCELLAVESVSASENFFAAGGHSLLVIIALQKISDRFGIEIPVVAFIENPTIRSIAAGIDRAREAGADSVAEPAMEEGVF